MGVLSDRLLAPDDGSNDPPISATVHDKDGSVIDTIPSSFTPGDGVIPVGICGDVLPDGVWAMPYTSTGLVDGVALYDADVTLLATVTALWPVGTVFQAAYLRSDHASAFWVLAYDSQSGGDVGSLHQIGEDGTILFSRAGVVDNSRVDWPTNNPSIHTINGFAVKYDGTVMYMLDGTFAPARVSVYDITNDLWDAAALITLTGYRADQLDGLILVNGGTTLAISHRAPTGSGTMTRYISLYSLAGALIATKTFLNTGESNEMGVDPSDDTCLYVKAIGASLLTYTIYKLSATDLSELQTPASGDTDIGGGVVPDSCPLLAFPAAVTTTVTEPIRWLRRAPFRRAA